MDNTFPQIILFDGVCNLCNNAIKFIIERDSQVKFVFAPLQSKIGIVYLKKFNLPQKGFKSFVLIEGDKYYLQSSAAIRVASRLDGVGWWLMKVFLVIPVFIRDGVYTFISNNRYSWFGARSECMMPTSELKKRFLD